VYKNADTEKKRQIIGSMYPEKLTFDGFAFRTARTNEAAHLIYTPGAGFGENEKGQSGNIPALSSQVALAGQFSNQFVGDLRRLALLAI